MPNEKNNKIQRDTYMELKIEDRKYIFLIFSRPWQWSQWVQDSKRLTDGVLEMCSQVIHFNVLMEFPIASN